MTPEIRRQVCDSARALVGIPWRGQGRDLMGIDCVGVPILAYQNAGLELDVPKATYQAVDSKLLMDLLKRFCDRLRPDEKPMPADVVVYGLPFEAHVAILVDDGAGGLNAIHCPMYRKVVEARFDQKRGNIRGYYRWRH